MKLHNFKVSSNSLFMCQDEDENEDEHQSFGSFWNLCMTNEPILQCIIVLRAWFVRHSLYPERTKKFVFGFVFVFVLVNEQPISKKPVFCNLSKQPKSLAETKNTHNGCSNGQKNCGSHRCHRMF